MILTVADLIAELQKYDPGMEVLTPMGDLRTSHVKVDRLPRRFKQPKPDAVLIYSSKDDFDDYADLLDCSTPPGHSAPND